MSSDGKHYSYDEVPYPDLSYAQTHPDRMAALGKLLGMTPALVNQCRVLEIGCAAGGNLLPMAAVLPGSTFMGIDNSAVQIERAQSILQGAALTNITFHKLDILDIDPQFGQFDYIIAHGIYSWVPPAVQDKLLDICQHNLAPQGIAYISYNTYPGWHSLEIIRNMMLYRTRDAASPEEKSAQAREWISFIADALATQSDLAYAAIFRNYLSFRGTQTQGFDHAALLHDELEANNQPVYFHQFMERAEHHNLQYLVEADFPTVMPNDMNAEVMEYLGKTARTTIEMEQYFDYLRNRTFRRTLLCHSDVQVDRRLSIRPLREFYVSTSAHPVEVDAEKAARGIETFEGTNLKFSTDHPLTKAAFHCLIDSAPQRIHFDALARQAALRLNMQQIQDQDVAALASNLLRAFSYSLNLIEFFSDAPRMTTQVSAYPLANALTRYQVQHRADVANLLHGWVELDDFSRLVLAHLDGQHDHAALLDLLVNLVETGEMSMQSSADTPANPVDLRSALARNLDTALRHLASLALLVA